MTPLEQLQSQVDEQEKTILRQYAVIARREKRISDLLRIIAQLERNVEQLRKRDFSERFFNG